MPRPIAKDDRVQQLNLQNRISHNNYDGVNVPAVETHQSISTSSAARASNMDNSVNQNSPNEDQEVVDFHTAQISEVKIEYPDCGDYNFVQSVPMIRIVRIDGRENDSAQLIGKKTEKTKNVETLVPHVKSSSQQAERAQTSHATTSFQGSIQNNNKIKEIAKKGLGSKEAVAEREKESNQSSSNGEVESSLASGSIVLKTNKKTNLSLKNFTTQKIPRFSTLEREPNLSNELLQNNEFENTLPKRLTRSQTRKQETNTTHEMPGRRLTRSQTQDGALFSELGAKGIQTQIVDATRSNVPKKKRKTSLPLPSDDVAAQPLAHSMETRARLRNTNWPSSSNANNAGNSGNVGKRKGGAKFNSKKSQYPKKKGENT
uniref:Uncharacterized protein n=1 Tax=Glossina austeni TaxID=7395 RepID=A0A1A9VYS0_GLOAU